MLIVTDSTRRVRCSAIRLLERILVLDAINDLTLSSHRASPPAVSGLASLSPTVTNTMPSSTPHPSTGPGSSNTSSLASPIGSGIGAATANLFTKQPSGSNLANGSNSTHGTSSSTTMHQQQGLLGFDSVLPVVRVSDCPTLSLSEHTPFRERLTLYFLRIIGACWSPALAVTGLTHEGHAMSGSGTGGVSSESSAGGGGSMTPNNTSNNNAAEGGLGSLFGMGMMGGGTGSEGTGLGNHLHYHHSYPFYHTPCDILLINLLPQPIKSRSYSPNQCPDSPSHPCITNIYSNIPLTLTLHYQHLLHHQDRVDRVSTSAKHNSSIFSLMHLVFSQKMSSPVWV